ncbi:hypothetical protein KUV51_13345 [Tateyamaria omphalii]|uniref:hypothetical protein n=1 Tax=Tateyamaria omphalii TaxID=299262 RepID=UPI001C99C2C4|nr:hypothetical protein [Tateyamaria omphalii]MBY5933990.1 hypothetical protein [Tateyamaria omphalii]
MMARDGFVVFDHDPRTMRWAEAARKTAEGLAADPKVQSANLRHGRTWFVGVDVLPNDTWGGVAGVPLAGPWQPHVPDLPLHAAQVSIVYPGYPVRDPDQSDANHRFRQTRMAAHVDGLLPEGPARRRFPREFHAYILGLPLNDVSASPTVIWPGSHRIMQAALAGAIGDNDPGQVDVTEAYHAARRTVFERCAPVPIRARPGQSFLIHRFALHGTQPWDGADTDGRMIAFFRPEFAKAGLWLSAP